jgi:hypothetical protein
MGHTQVPAEDNAMGDVDEHSITRAVIEGLGLKPFPIPDEAAPHA